jgi:hypothetical protein
VTYKSLQKSMALTPRAPSAGPTGGEGVALPAGMTSFYNRKESALLDFVGSMQMIWYAAHDNLLCGDLGHGEMSSPR